MKKLLIVFVIVWALLAGCKPFDDRTDRDVIFSFVEENQDQLLSSMESGDFSSLEGPFSSEDIYVADDHVDFYCGGAGFGSATAYQGFFYSEAEDLYAVWCAPSPEQSLTAQGDGFFWQETRGDNTYYVEKICDGFFYYEASF